MPPIGIPLVLEDKGHLTKMFEPWHSKVDSKNTTFKSTMFSKCYNGIINATHRFLIPQELLNCNTRNIIFSMNRHHTFVWSRYANMEDFHSRMMSFYLYEEAFEK
jgi:hypothetical protein